MPKMSENNYLFYYQLNLIFFLILAKLYQKLDPIKI